MDDLDLYADVGDEFGHDDLDHSGAGADGGVDDDHGDLFDDVVASSSVDTKEGIRPKNEPGSPSGANSSASGQAPTRRYQLYVGNLTWWTTDQDIQDAVQELNISDFIEVKFFENRANGQSKGFCCVVLGSEASMRHVMDQLAKKELHGQVPVVTWATKTALHQFESQSKTRPPQPSAQTGGGVPMRGPPMSSRGMAGGGGIDRGRPQSMRGPPHSSSSSNYSRPPPAMGSVGGAGLRGPPPGLGLSAPPPGLPPPIIVGAPPPLMLSRGPPPGLPGAAPAPHVNPAFFPHGPPPGAGYAAPGVALGISEAEFDEIMSRNRTVSSSAIARAVQDAAAGEYASAIETLVTAISLIKQSKVANDDRCRILVSSLQDTLHGIENKSYGASRSGGMRSRSRSRDRAHRGYREYGHSHGHSRTPDDRGHYRDDRGHGHYERRNEEERYRREYRERSRSRERQDRDKYYEERDHGKYYEERERRTKK